MSDTPLDAFGELLVKQVRDVTIEMWDRFVDGKMKDSNSGWTREMLASFDAHQLDILHRLIPDIVDTALDQLLYTFEQYDWVAIALRTEDGVVPDIRQIAEGDLQGYLYSWIPKFSKKRREEADD